MELCLDFFRKMSHAEVMSEMKQKTYKPRITRKIGGLPLKEALNKINQGLTIRDFDVLKKKLNISESQLCNLLSLTPRTLSRRRQQNARFSRSESDRMLRITKILSLATQTIGRQSDALLWLASPQLALDNIPPISLLDTEIGTRAIEDLLFQIQHGIFA